MAQVKQQNDLVLTFNRCDGENITASQRGKWMVCRIVDHGPIPIGLFDTKQDVIDCVTELVQTIWPQ